MGRCCSLHCGTVLGKVSVLLLAFTRFRGELCKTRHPDQSLISIQCIVKVSQDVMKSYMTSQWLPFCF